MLNHEQRWHDELLDAALPDPDIEELAIEVTEYPDSVRDLLIAVRRAASELEGTSEKADRIALQLLTAAAEVHKETGL